MWPTYWPPVAEAFLVAAERTGAVLVTASCLYGYGPVDEPMVEGMPDAATGDEGRGSGPAMWAEALAAPRGRPDPGRRGARLGLHGPGGHGRARTSRRSRRAALAGKAVRVFGRPGPAALVHRRARHGSGAGRGGRRAAGVGPGLARADQPAGDPGAGRRRRVPGRRPRAGDGARAGRGRCSAIGGRLVPVLREMRETDYQFQRPYVLDSSAIERELGLAPTPWDEVCRATAEAAGVPAALVG